MLSIASLVFGLFLSIILSISLYVLDTSDAGPDSSCSIFSKIYFTLVYAEVIGYP